MQALLTDKELLDFKKKADALRKKKYSYQESDALQAAEVNLKVRRAQGRMEEYLNGLIILVGSRGSAYVPFEEAFERSDDPIVIEALEKYNTPEARRDLFYILKALTQIPKTWARSAFTRFLRGTGKQKNSPYDGAGLFGTIYGWKGAEVEAIAKVVAGDNWGHYASYSSVLMSYKDMYNEISDAANQEGYDTIDVDARNYATNADRDVEFLLQCCAWLREKGLADKPTPKAKKPKKARNPKVFKKGDTIRKRHLRDLPLPALVEIPIQRWDNEKREWDTESTETIKYVVIALGNDGYYQHALVEPSSGRAYPTGELWNGEYPSRHKDDLDGAIYLGKWTKAIATNKIVRLDFSWRVKRT